MWAARSWGAEGARGDAIISLEQWAHSARCDEKIDSSSSRAWTGCRTCPGVKAATVIRCESGRVMRDATCVQSRSTKAGVRGGVEAKGWGGQIGRQSRRREGGRWSAKLGTGSSDQLLQSAGEVTFGSTGARFKNTPQKTGCADRAPSPEVWWQKHWSWMLSDYILDSWKHILTIAMGGTVVHKEHIYISCARLIGPIPQVQV